MLTCEELRELAEIHPLEIEVIIEMLMEVDEEACRDADLSLVVTPVRQASNHPGAA
jgi:hypothetical protein